MTQLPIQQLKSFACRLHAAIQLQSKPLPPPSNSENVDSFEILIRGIQAHCDIPPTGTGVGVSTPEGTMVVDLHDLVEYAKQLADGLSEEGPGERDMRERISQLGSDLLKINCGTCSGGRGPCDGKDRERDQENIRLGGSCITPLKLLKEFVEGRTHALYAEYADLLSPPHIDLQTASVDSHFDKDIFNEFWISGRCEVSDENAADSIVTLTLKHGSFEWATMCHAYYTLAHELVCHAYQGLNGEGRKNVNEKCCWSEGWMDVIAYSLAIEWLTATPAPSGMPPFLQHNKKKIQDHCSALHKRRYEPTASMNVTDTGRRESARETYDVLEQIWKRSDPTRALRFSLKLNSLALDQKTRARILNLISTALELRLSALHEMAAGICSRFLQHSNADLLLAELSTAMNTTAG